MVNKNSSAFAIW